MVRRLLLELLVLLLVFAGLWFLIASLKLAPDHTKLQITIEQEEKLGNIITEAILKTETVVHSNLADNAIDTIFNRLSSTLDTSSYTYKFYIVRNDEVNAMTLPGGNIIIYSGLIDFVKTPEELAAVIAHEMGHVENRDVIYKLAKEIGITVVLAVILNTDNSVITDVSRMIVSGVFSREQEALADRFAFGLMADSGIKPSSLASFFMRLKKEKGSFDERLEFFMTHPHDSKRITASLEYKLPDDFKEHPLQIDMEEIRQDM